MSNRSDLEALLARVEAATGPDEKLDRAIASALDVSWSSDEGGQFGGYDIMPKRVRFSSSLDAVVALIEKRLPGLSRQVIKHFDDCFVDLYELGDLQTTSNGLLDRPILRHFEGRHNVEALAHLAALLRAELARSEEDR